jgi:hypothetical protein
VGQPLDESFCFAAEGFISNDEDTYCDGTCNARLLPYKWNMISDEVLAGVWSLVASDPVHHPLLFLWESLANYVCMAVISFCICCFTSCWIMSGNCCFMASRSVSNVACASWEIVVVDDSPLDWGFSWCWFLRCWFGLCWQGRFGKASVRLYTTWTLRLGGCGGGALFALLLVSSSWELPKWASTLSYN